MDELIQKITDLVNACTSHTHPYISYHISAPPDIKPLLKSHFPVSTNSPCTTYTITYNPLQVVCTNPTLHLHGTYTKLSRGISQTPHMGCESVADFTVDVERFYNADSVTFIGNGREDVNVLCYGREYVLDVINPKQNLGKVFEGRELVVVDKTFRTEFVNKRSCKMYRAVVYCDSWDQQYLKSMCNIFDKAIEDPSDVYLKEDLNNDDECNIQVQNKSDDNYKSKAANNVLRPEYLKDIHLGLEKNEKIKYTLSQKTPIRVLHRRANMVRERNIELLRVRKFVDRYEFIMRADAGTYIKEFVNGDFDRTKPSLSDLNNAYCDCVELDVIKLEN